MDDLPTLFGGLAVLAGILASIAIWTPRKVWLKVAALCTLAFFLPVGYFAMIGLLSRPKPMDMEWLHRQMEQAQVLGTRLKEGEAIYIWLQMEGVEEQLAKQIHGAKREAESKGSALMMGKPFQSSLENREKKFYVAPQPKLPPKQQQGEQPLEFENHSSKESLRALSETPEAASPPLVEPTRSRHR